MSKNISPQDTEKVVTTMNSETEERVSFLRVSIRFLFQELIHFTSFFLQPIQYFKDFKPRRNILIDFISGAVSLVIVALGILLGTFAVTYRETFYYDGDNPCTNFWEEYHSYFAYVVIGFWIPLLLFNLITNEKNKELGFIRTIIYNLRLLFKTGIPVACGFTLWLVAVAFKPESWNIDKLAIYFLIVIHLFLIWQCLIIGSQIFATSGKKKFAIVFPIIIFVAVIIVEKIFATMLQGEIWHDPSIFSMYRAFIFEGL